MIRQIANFIGKFGNIDAMQPIPDKKDWNSPALKTFLENYPNICSMKNFRTLEILQENQKLRKKIGLLELDKANLDEVSKNEVEELLNTIVEMSHFTDVNNQDIISKIMIRHGYYVSDDGYLERKVGI